MKFRQNISVATNVDCTLVSILHTPANNRKQINVLVILCCLISVTLPRFLPFTLLTSFNYNSSGFDGFMPS